MTGTTWTVNRETLVRDLAAVRAENEYWRRRADTRRIKEEERLARIRDAEKRRKAEQRERKRKAREAAVPDAAAQLAFRLTPSDPNAELHRQILINALKENA